MGLSVSQMLFFCLKCDYFFKKKERYQMQCFCIFLTLFLLVATCRLLITFANSLDPDQDRQNVGPDLDPNYLTCAKRIF